MEIISSQKARKMVHPWGWKHIQDGKQWVSKNLKWWVYKAGNGMYKRRPTELY